MSLKFRFLKDENIPADDAAENKRKKDEMLKDLRYNLSKMSDLEIEHFLREEFEKRGKYIDVRKIWDPTQGISGFSGLFGGFSSDNGVTWQTGVTGVTWQTGNITSSTTTIPYTYSTGSLGIVSTGGTGSQTSGSSLT